MMTMTYTRASLRRLLSLLSLVDGTCLATCDVAASYGSDSSPPGLATFDGLRILQVADVSCAELWAVTAADLLPTDESRDMLQLQWHGVHSSRPRLYDRPRDFYAAWADERTRGDFQTRSVSLTPSTV